MDDHSTGHQPGREDARNQAMGPRGQANEVLADEVLADAMREALHLARRGPQADPNPRVGCVILSPSGEIVGRGWHQGAGSPHAEVMALREAADRARGATAVVTLEPCNHTGRTGPCSQALLAAGIVRVVHAQRDPNPLAAGGAATLRQAGVRVEAGLLAGQAEELNRSWSHAARTGRPLVTWKFAATLDGFSAAADGSSQWITGAEIRTAMHQRRSACGAVVVGTATVLADDPLLTARDANGAELDDQPLRVAVGATPIPATARIRGSDDRFCQLTSHDADEVLRELARRGIHHVWLEGGPRLAAAWWSQGAVDEVICCLAPALLGDGMPAVADLGITDIAGIARLSLRQVERFGDDLALTLDALPPTPTPSHRPAPATQEL